MRVYLVLLLFCCGAMSTRSRRYTIPCSTLTDAVEAASAALNFPALRCGDLFGTKCAQFGAHCNIMSTDALFIADEPDALALSFPQLRTVGRVLINNNANLTSISIPQLYSSSDAVIVQINAQLASVDLRRLETTSNEFSLAFNPALSLLQIGSLRSVGAYLLVGNNNQSAVFQLPALQQVGTFLRIDRAQSLQLCQNLVTVEAGRACNYPNDTSCLLCQTTALQSPSCSFVNPSCSSFAPTTQRPTGAPTSIPSSSPTQNPTMAPSAAPSTAPSLAPTATPTAAPSGNPTAFPTAGSTPTMAPSAAPSSAPSLIPAATPTAAPSSNSTASPTAGGTQAPTSQVVYSCPSCINVPMRNCSFGCDQRSEDAFDDIEWTLNSVGDLIQFRLLVSESLDIDPQQISKRKMYRVGIEQISKPAEGQSNTLISYTMLGAPADATTHERKKEISCRSNTPSTVQGVCNALGTGLVGQQLQCIEGSASTPVKFKVSFQVMINPLCIESAAAAIGPASIFLLLVSLLTALLSYA